MAFNADQFRSVLVDDGARPNLFEVELGFPSYVQNVASLARFMVKTAQLPGSTLGSVPLQYFGREVKVAGNRTFADWTVTIINDENFAIRNSMDAWMRGINNNVTNLRSNSARNTSSGGRLIGNTGGYASDATVTQYRKTGGTAKRYRFVGMFPIDITPIDLDWGSNDTVEEFSVTFQYQYWTEVSTTSGFTGTSLFTTTA